MLIAIWCCRKTSSSNAANLFFFQQTTACTWKWIPWARWVVDLGIGRDQENPRLVTAWCWNVFQVKRAGVIGCPTYGPSSRGSSNRLGYWWPYRNRSWWAWEWAGQSPCNSRFNQGGRNSKGVRDWWWPRTGWYRWRTCA